MVTRSQKAGSAWQNWHRAYWTLEVKGGVMDLGRDREKMDSDLGVQGRREEQRQKEAEAAPVLGQGGGAPAGVEGKAGDS